MVWFKNKKKFTSITKIDKKKTMPEGVWRTCDSCGEYITNKEITRNQYICPKCGFYYVLPVEERVLSLLDENSFEEFDATLASKNPLDFDGYEKKLVQAQEKTGRNEACVSGRGRIHGLPVIVSVLDFAFMGG
ncbi:MAG: acetyl-CoA carboxylase carboxyl transferase subunit beta, partial [bacterium]|nr:acetyl-CoA carboxylase carboxyl transferase subunit beta [bacterium]